MFSLTLQGPCESDPQLPGAVGQEGLKGSVLPAALKQEGLGQEAAWAEGPAAGGESGAVNAAIFLAPRSAGLWEMLLPTQEGRGFGGSHISHWAPSEM